jgi:hypothetical protein
MTIRTPALRTLRNMSFLALLLVCVFTATAKVGAIQCSVDGYEYPLGYIKWVNCIYYTSPPCSDYYARQAQCDQACRNTGYGWGGGFIDVCNDEEYWDGMWGLTYMGCTCWG